MARKARKKAHPMPKLGWKDQLIYWTAMLLTLLGIPGSLFFVLIYHNDSVFHGEDVAACSFSWIGLSGFSMVWFLICFVSICMGPYKQRKPLFGADGVKYGPPKYPEVYPLFMKNAPTKWLSTKQYNAQKKKHRIVTVLLLISLLFSLAMYHLSIYGRTVLRPDGSISVYSFFDKESAQYDSTDVTEVRLGIFRQRQKGNFGRYMVDLKILTADGQCHRFIQNDFNKVWGDGSYISEYLSMLEIKELFASKVVIDPVYDLQKVMDGLDLNEEETALLYELFMTEQ